MKRYNNLFEKICDFDNLKLAAANASAGKAQRQAVKTFYAKETENLQALRESLLNGTFKPSKYKQYEIEENASRKASKKRIISELPFFPDQILQHAVKQVLGPIFEATFTADTYCCIKGRGIHLCATKIQKALKEDPEGTKYCFKGDIRHFYQEIDHAILKDGIRTKIKDKRTLDLLDLLISASDEDPVLIKKGKNGRMLKAEKTPGKSIPIGNFTSPFYANIYLNKMDHFIKEVLKVKYYYRYADDITIFASSKEELHRIQKAIYEFLAGLKLQLKSNWQIFPVDARGVDFLGYVFFHGYTLLRKSIKRNFCRRIAKLNKRVGLTEAEFKRETGSWWGWAKYCDSRHLIQTINKRSKYEIKFKRKAA